MLHKLYQKIKAYPTFKIYCNFAFAAEFAVMIFELYCQKNALSDVQAVMQDDAIAFGCTIIAYTLKSGFEHSKFATPQQAVMQQIADHPVTTAAISGLISSGGDITAAASSALSAAQMEAEQEKEQSNTGNQPDIVDNNNNMAG